ncbi:flavodoxin family protein [Halobacillus fulvus]|nr:flavodoxin family protein [Halobacillus fulvus]
MKILTISGSSRENGNTDILLSKVTDKVDNTHIRLSDYKVNPIVDQRHTGEGFTRVEDDYEKLLQQFLEHDCIVFVTPIYWFGMSGHMKLFFDRWSQYMRDDRFSFKEKVKEKQAYVIITGGSNPKITGLPLIQQFGHIFDFVGMNFTDYLIGDAVRPGDILNDFHALQKANDWNSHFLHKQNKRL